MLYKMFEWQGVQDGHGAYGFERWQKLNPAQGQYDWAIIDRWLDKQNGKPCAFSVATHLSSMDGWESFVDCTPEWVYGADRPTLNGRRVGHVVEYTDTNGRLFHAALPAYEDRTGWWQALREFMLAFGARYDADPRLTVVFGGPGLDMENNNTKPPVGDANTGYRFGQLCTEFIRWLAEAFPTKPAFYVCTTGQGRLEQAKLAGSLGLGVKNNGLLPDMDSHQGYGVFVGSFDPLAWANENGVPVWIETAHWLGKENMYWSIPACLHYHPAGVDVHSGWFDSMPQEQLDFWSRHVGVTAETAPGAFVVLRDSEYPKRTWTQSGALAGCSGHVGDWEFYMRRLSGDAGSPRVTNVGPADAPESRQCRLVTDATFHVELVAGPPYELSIRYLDEAASISVDVGDTHIPGHGTGQWVTAKQVITARAFRVTSSAGAHIHMLYATPIVVPEPVPPDPEPPTPPAPVLDLAVMWAAVDGAQEDIDNARRECYLADCAIGLASAEIANATRALQAAVSQHEEASKQAVAAMETLDLATGHLADLRAELEKVS